MIMCGSVMLEAELSIDNEIRIPVSITQRCYLKHAVYSNKDGFVFWVFFLFGGQLLCFKYSIIYLAFVLKSIREDSLSVYVHDCLQSDNQMSVRNLIG